MDGVGEWATTSAWIGKDKDIEPLWQISFPHSLGLLYSAFTYYCGFKVNSGEYKLMGLAPYGESRYVDKIKDNLIDIKEDGTFRLEMSYFKYHRGFRMTGRKFHKLFGSPPRQGETELTQFHMDLAASIQVVTEEIVLKLAKSLREDTSIKNICLAGGVALNCVANGKLLKENIFEDDDLPINSEALPTIWENWDDFVSKSEDLEFVLEGVDTSTLIDLRGSL